jgi:ribonuclease BN (tRNA processing enzyme)
MEIIFIGTGCGVPVKKRGPSSILMKIKDELLWFDTGPGNLRKLLEVGYTYKDVDYLLYTHFHIDHIADFGPIIFASKYEGDLREKDLTVIGPPGMIKFYQKLLNLYGEQIQELNYDINIVELKDKLSTTGWEICSMKVPHMPESIAYRVKDERGKVVVYTGDTSYFPELSEFAKKADMLIIECSFPVPTPGHLYPEAVGKIANEAQAKEIIITHIYPECDREDILTPVCTKFKGKARIAYDLMKINI